MFFFRNLEPKITDSERFGATLKGVTKLLPSIVNERVTKPDICISLPFAALAEDIRELSTLRRFKYVIPHGKFLMKGKSGEVS